MIHRIIAWFRQVSGADLKAIRVQADFWSAELQRNTEVMRYHHDLKEWHEFGMACLRWNVAARRYNAEVCRKMGYAELDMLPVVLVRREAD